MNWHWSAVSRTSTNCDRAAIASAVGDDRRGNIVNRFSAELNTRRVFRPFPAGPAGQCRSTRCHWPGGYPRILATGGRFGELGGEPAALLDFDEGDFGWRGDRRRRIQQTGASERRRPVLVTAAFTGMRASEFRGLPWDAIDFENRVIRVRQRADHWGTLSPPKTAAGRREVPMARTPQGVAGMARGLSVR